MTLSRPYIQLWMKHDACDFVHCVVNHGAPRLPWSEPTLPLTEKKAQSPLCHLLLTTPSMASHGPQDGQFPGHSCFGPSLPPLPSACLLPLAVGRCPHACTAVLPSHWTTLSHMLQTLPPDACAQTPPCTPTPLHCTGLAIL